MCEYDVVELLYFAKLLLFLRLLNDSLFLFQINEAGSLFLSTLVVIIVVIVVILIPVVIDSRDRISNCNSGGE